MRKAEFIKKYGIKAYERAQQQWNEGSRLRRLNHPKEVIANHRKEARKGGKYYKHYREHQSTGIPGERNLIRNKHRSRYRKYKRIIAPDSQIHHQWIPNTAMYRGVALVEKYQHQYGFIDVIQILEGEITLLSEEDIKTSE